MGTTVNNIHVFVGERADGAAQRVADAYQGSALVSPPLSGWVSVFPADENLGDDQPAIDLSNNLAIPCVSFFCFDSDIALASLIVAGEVVDQIAISMPDFFEEATGEPPPGEPVPGIEADMAVTANLDVWLSTLGVGDLNQITAAVNGDPECPFADQVACAILGNLGIDAERLTMAHRFYAQGDGPAARASFLDAGH